MGALTPIYDIAQPYGLRCRYLCNEEQLEGKSGGYSIPVHGSGIPVAGARHWSVSCGAVRTWEPGRSGRCSSSFARYPARGKASDRGLIPWLREHVLSVLTRARVPAIPSLDRLRYVLIPPARVRNARIAAFGRESPEGLLQMASSRGNSSSNSVY